MNKIIIVGIVSKYEVYLASSQPFKQNEYLMARTPEKISIPMEIVETYAMPVISNDVTLPVEMNGISFRQIEQSLSCPENVFIGKANLLGKMKFPINPSSLIEHPRFAEISDVLLHANPEDCFNLGVVSGTEDLYSDLPAELKTISPLWKDGEAVDQDAVPFVFDYRKFREYPHIGLFGTSGSGKSFGLRVICEELMDKNIPGIALDPHNELTFSQTMNGIIPEKSNLRYINKHQFFVVGKDVGIPFEELNSDELIYLIEYVGSLSEAMKSALEAIYEKGDTLILLKNKLTKLRDAFEEMDKVYGKVENLDTDGAKLYRRYKNKIASLGTLQGVIWRLDSLEATGIFRSSKGIDVVEKAMYQGKLAILRGNMMHLQMISFYAIRKLYRKRRAYQESLSDGNNTKPYFPMFFTILDEAHNFCPRNSSNPTKRLLKEIAQEARKYGVFEVFCTQRPDGLDETIFAQINTKVIFRMNTASDMELISKETNLTNEEMKLLPNLASGHCFVASATLPKTYSVRFRTTYTKSPHQLDPFDELGQMLEKKDDLLMDVMTMFADKTGFSLNQIPQYIGQIEEEYGRPVDFNMIKEALDNMAEEKIVKIKATPMGPIYTAI